jgi:hypothetical protein
MQQAHGRLLLHMRARQHATRAHKRTRKTVPSVLRDDPQPMQPREIRAHVRVLLPRERSRHGVASARRNTSSVQHVIHPLQHIESLTN